MGIERIEIRPALRATSRPFFNGTAEPKTRGERSVLRVDRVELL
jgi:hypothetical protein